MHGNMGLGVLPTPPPKNKKEEWPLYGVNVLACVSLCVCWFTGVCFYIGFSNCVGMLVRLLVYWYVCWCAGMCVSVLVCVLVCWYVCWCAVYVC